MAEKKDDEHHEEYALSQKFLDKYHQEKIKKMLAPIFWVVIPTIIILGIGLIISSYLVIYASIYYIFDDYYEIDSQDFFFLLLQISSLAGLFLSCLLYTSWYGHIFKTYISLDLNQKQYELDFNRAKWIIATAHSWRNQTGSEMPDTLLEQLSDNLFKPLELESWKSGNNRLDSLLSSASNLKIKSDTNEVDFDKKSIKSLGN